MQERLQSHAKAFESLLALTPAREYYGSQIDDGQDPSEQWNRKKQTKEQKRAAKKAKLDPANQKSALDVMKERERKRKRELGMEDEEVNEEEGEKGHVKEGGEKRQKTEDGGDAGEAKRKAKAEKRKEKRELKKEKLTAKKVKTEAKKAAKQDQDLDELQPGKRQTESAKAGAADELVEQGEEQDSPDDTMPDAGLDAFDASGLTEGPSPIQQGEEENDNHVSEDSSVPSSSVADSPAFDVATNHSTASSSSSILPPPHSEQQTQLPGQQKLPASKPVVDTSTKPDTQSKRVDATSGTSSPKVQLPDIDQAELQERLRARIEELRARRKADGPEGKPARSRQELLEQRRKKEEQRKATKKEQRRKAKEDEQRKREEQLRAGSGSPMSADMFSPRTDRSQENNFNFSRLAFQDGTQTNADFSGLQSAPRKKGPQDPRTALEAAKNKQKRVSGYDAEKRADIAEKDLWLNAKKRAHGERVRDDTSLLKKALKRKEKQKDKSEKAWKEREDTVVKGKEMKQKKRETNLQKRKEEKGAKGKKKPSGGASKGKKSGGRPGFEGRFKA